MGADADGMPLHAAAVLEASAEGSGRDGVPLGGGAWDGGRRNAAARGAEQGGDDGAVQEGYGCERTEVRATTREKDAPSAICGPRPRQRL